MKHNYSIASSIQVDLEEAISLLLSEDHFMSNSTYRVAGNAVEALEDALEYIKKLKRLSR